MFFIFLSLAVLGPALFGADELTLDEAKALSAKTNKPLLLDFFTEW
jgi:hypothetical protein